MSLHYLLDGYNIIHQMPLSPGGLEKLEDQRRQLVQWLESSRPQGSPNNTVTVVFDSSMAPDFPGFEQEAPLRIDPERSRRVDGRTDVWSPAEVSSVRIVFAQGESADQKIIRTVEESDTKKNFVVVTDDRSLQHAVRALGAKISSVSAFRDQAKGSPSVSQLPAMGKHISKTLEQKITSELARIWLREKKGGEP